MATKKAHASFINPVIIILFVFTLLFIVSGTYLYMRRTKPTVTDGNKTAIPTTKPTPTPTPAKLLPDKEGKGTYNVSTSQAAGPRVTRVVFNPLEAKKGQPLTITVTVVNDVPVQKVTSVFVTDNSKEYPVFTFVSRTDTTEVWQTTFTQLPESVDYMYSLTVKAESTNGSGTGGASPRSR